MKKPKIKERRVYPRLGIYHLAKYRLISRPQEPLVVASVKDISGGGIRLKVDEKIPLSSVIQVYINFPHISEPIPSLAKVVWIRKIHRSNRYEVGLQFLEMENILRQAVIKQVENVTKITNKIEKSG